MKIKHCERCGGRGVVDLSTCDKAGCMVYHVPKLVDCQGCDGTGHIVTDEDLVKGQAAPTKEKD